MIVITALSIMFPSPLKYHFPPPPSLISHNCPPQTPTKSSPSHNPQGIDAVQQYGLGQGDQSNESAVEQAKDEQISDFIRGKYKGATGEEFPVEDKETRFG